MLGGEAYVGEHVGFALVDEGGPLWLFGTELVGGVAQRLAGADAVRLMNASLAQSGADHDLLALAYV